MDIDPGSDGCLLLGEKLACDGTMGFELTDPLGARPFQYGH